MEVSIKQIGQNLILNLEGEIYTKRVEDKVERESIKSLVKQGLESKSKAAKSKIAKLLKSKFTSSTKQVKEKESILKTAAKKIAKKVTTTTTKKAVKNSKEVSVDKTIRDLKLENEKLKEELEKLKAKEEEKPKASYGRSRSGEY